MRITHLYFGMKNHVLKLRIDDLLLHGEKIQEHKISYNNMNIIIHRPKRKLGLGCNGWDRISFIHHC